MKVVRNRDSDVPQKSIEVGIDSDTNIQRKENRVSQALGKGRK